MVDEPSEQLPEQVPVTLDGMSSGDRTSLFSMIGHEEYFKIVRRDARRSDEESVEQEIRLRSQMRQEARDFGSRPSVLNRIKRRWSGES